MLYFLDVNWNDADYAASIIEMYELIPQTAYLVNRNRTRRMTFYSERKRDLAAEKLENHDVDYELSSS